MSVKTWVKDEQHNNLTMYKGAVVVPSAGKELYRVQNGQKIAYFQKTNQVSTKYVDDSPHLFTGK